MPLAEINQEGTVPSKGLSESSTKPTSPEIAYRATPRPTEFALSVTDSAILSPHSSEVRPLTTQEHDDLHLKRLGRAPILQVRFPAS